MSHTNTSKSQATNRISCHVSRRYQQITGNKSYFLPCLMQIPANHRQQIVFLAMSHTDTSKSQATNRTSCHVSDTSKSQATNRTSCHVLHRTCKSQSTNRTSCHVSRRYQQVTGNKLYFLTCLTQIPANHRQQIVLLAMSHADTSKSQSTNRTSCHVSRRYQQITGNKSYFLPCLTQIPANHRQQIVLLAMSHADTSKSQATNRTSCHVSRRYQQITGNKSYFLPCLTQIPANHRQQIILLAMSHADTSKSQATNRTSCHVSDTSKSQATNRTSCHVSRRYQQITGNKSYFLPCLTQIPANHRQQIVLLAMSHTDTSKSQATDRTSCHVPRRYQQMTGNKSYFLPCLTQIPANHRQKSYFLPCLTQIPANHRQQIVLLAMSHADTSKSQATNRISCHVSHRYQQITGNKSYFLPCLRYQQITGNKSYFLPCFTQNPQITVNKSYFLPCLTQIPANHRQQIVLLAMSHTDTSKSQATNRTSCHVSRRCQQITGNKSYFLLNLTQIPADHRQQIVLLAMSHADTSKSQAANRTSCHVSRRYQQITGNKSYFLPCLMQIPANHRQQIVLLAMSHADTSKSQATNRTSCHVSHRYQQITGNKSYFLPCLRYQQITGNKSYFLPCLTQIPANHRQQIVLLAMSQIPANHRQQIVLLAMSHADTSKSQATNRTSCHVSRRYQQITGNKSYFLPCLTQVPANHRQQIVLLAMSHADTSKSQATNRTSCHVSRRYQQITGNKSYFLPCLRQQIVLLAMPHTDTSKSQTTSRTSCHVSRGYQQITGNKSYFLPCLMQIPANHRQQIIFLAMSHADTSKSQATNRTSCHVSCRYQQITGNKSYFLPCLTQIPANHRHRSYFLPCLTQIPANHRQQIVLLAMSHADTSKSHATNRTSCHVSHRYQQIHRKQIVLLAMSHTDTSKSQATYRTSCHVSDTSKSQATNRTSCQIPANNRQQIVLLAMSHADTSKSQATNRTSCHVSRRYQQITGNKSYFLPCLTQIPANHRQQNVLLAMSHADTSKSQATNRTSCHVSPRYQQLTGNKSYFLPCLTQIPANHRQQIVLLAMSHADTSKSQATNRTSRHVSRRYQQITGNKSYFLSCLTQIPANHRQQIVLLAMSHADTSKSQATNRTSCHVSRRYQQITGNKSYFCHVSHRYQQISGNKSYFLPCLTQIPANHRQQTVLLAMSHADTSKSQATNRTSCHVSRRYQQITGNKIVLLAMSRADSSKSQATNRTSCHVSRRYQQITGNKSYFLPCLTQKITGNKSYFMHWKAYNHKSE